MSSRHDLGKAIWPSKRLWNNSMDDFFNKKNFFNKIVFIYGCQIALATIRISYTYICIITSLQKSQFNNYPSLVGFILLTLEWEETEADRSFLIPTFIIPKFNKGCAFEALLFSHVESNLWKNGNTQFSFENCFH